MNPSQIDRLNTALAGRYRIERELGEGGMATVYLCEDIKHKRNVALKLLKPELAAVLGAERFVVVVDSSTKEGRSFDYERLMFDTVFTLILRGDQPYSYRYTEAVCSGAVPVMVASGGWVPPFSSLHPFTEYGVLVQEDEMPGLVARLRATTNVEVERLRHAAKQFCMQHLITVHQQVDSMIESSLLAE